MLFQHLLNHWQLLHMFFELALAVPLAWIGGISVWPHIRRRKSQLLFQINPLTSSYLSNRYPSLWDEWHKVKAQAAVQRQHPPPWKDHYCWTTALLLPRSQVEGRLPQFQGHRQSLWSGLRQFHIHDPTAGRQRGDGTAKHVGDVWSDHSYSERDQVGPWSDCFWCSGGQEGLWGF